MIVRSTSGREKVDSKLSSHFNATNGGSDCELVTLLLELSWSAAVAVADSRTCTAEVSLDEGEAHIHARQTGQRSMDRVEMELEV